MSNAQKKAGQGAIQSPGNTSKQPGSAKIEALSDEDLEKVAGGMRKADGSTNAKTDIYRKTHPKSV